MTEDVLSKLHRLRRQNSDWLLTLLTVVLTLNSVYSSSLRSSSGYFLLFQTFAIAGLLVIVGGALIISATRSHSA